MQKIDSWERAYLDFETPEQEARKFIKRFRSIGAGDWDRDLKIVEVFCGRGSALIAWERLGFRHLVGIDLSERLLSDYRGAARCIVADARAMPLADGSMDIVSVQGGLHHLESLDDLDKVLSEIHRVLRPGGRLLVIEPWLTPFLRFVHWTCQINLARRVSKKLRALGTMIDHERKTYELWLGTGAKILPMLEKRFTPVGHSKSFGKLIFLGTRKESLPDMSEHPLVSVVLPCLDEEESVATVLGKLQTIFKENRINGEIVVCDNGSTDRSASIARSFGVRVVEEARRGYGSAYLTGFSHACGQYLVMGDIDDTYDFRLIPAFLAAMTKEGRDFVTGSRYLGENVREIPWLHRYIGNPLLTWILNRLFGCSYTDVYCGFRAFHKDAYAKICPVSTGMEFNLELAINASLAGLKIKEIPIVLGPRKGTSKLQMFRDGWRSLRMMLLYCPNKLFFYPGFSLLFIGVALEGLTVFRGLTYHGRAFGMVTAFCGSMACIMAFKLLALGLHAKTYSWSRRFEPTNSALAKFYRIFKLETGIGLGLFSVFLGGLILVVLTVGWFKSGLLPLQNPEMAVLGGTLVVVGTETVFTSFFISAMSIAKRNPDERPVAEQP